MGIDAFGEGQQYVKKHTVTYSNPNVNPFRTLPKDAPARAGKDGPNNRATSGGYNNDRGNNQNGNFGGNFRGRTPGYNARGGMNNNMMGMPMGGMPMGGLPGGMGGMPMGMGQMGGGMPGGGFQGMQQPHFNPAFFPQNQAAGS